MSLSIFHQINKKYYTRKDNRKLRKIAKIVGFCVFLTGIILGGYFFFPFISWKLYLEPVFASQSYTAPIPKTTIVTKDYIQSLWLNTARSFQGFTDYNASNWIPPSPFSESGVETRVSYFHISIPKIKIRDAKVSTVDTDLSAHLVNFPGTAIPPAKGNSAVFGHSTLPPLFDHNNYKTIFANLHTLNVGDSINITTNDTAYTYKIFNISIVEADDESYLSQDNGDSYLTLVTCTPPGTLWKRLIIKSRLENI